MSKRVFWLSFFAFLIVASTCRADNCNDQCRHQIPPFGNVVDPVCVEACKRKIPTGPKPPGPDVLTECARNPSKCPEKLLAAPVMETIRPFWDAYRGYLFEQARNGWLTLPEWFQKEFAGEFHPVDLSTVRYATNIDTKHGQHITIGNNIFFARSKLDLTFRSEKELMLHELQHVVQYALRGGEGVFIPEYLAKGAAEILERRKISIHDDIELEHDAARKAKNLIARYGSDISVRNSCRIGSYQIFLEYNINGSWEKNPQPYVIAPNVTTFLTRGTGGLIHSADTVIWYFAENLEAKMQTGGGTRTVNIGNGRSVSMYAQRFDPNADAPTLIDLRCN